MMYCWKCHYDLQGQIELRCPECGCPFDSQDANTYLAKVPTRLRASFNKFKPYAKFLTIAGLYEILVILFLPGLFSSRCGPLSGRVLSRGLLHSVIQAYHQNIDVSLADRPLTIEDIRQDLRPSWYSRSVESKYVQNNNRQRKVADVFLWAVFAIGPLVSAIVLTKRWFRKLAIITTILCTFFIAFVFIIVFVGSSFMRNPSYDYLDDYVFIPSNVDWHNWDSYRGDEIVAFEKNPWLGGWRVAAGPWKVTALKEAEFQQLLLKQPLAKQAWDRCLIAGECTRVDGTVPPKAEQ